jgi:hypothetical protein
MAVNCCVFPTATLAVVGETETPVAELCDMPEQLEKRTETQTKPFKSETQRMKILSGAGGP